MSTDDPRLNLLIKQGGTGDIVIIGCPFDFFRKRSIQKGGEDDGPCCLRRFYPKVGPLINPEYGIDISKLNVTDLGNIRIQMSEEEEDKRFKNVKTRKFKGDYVNYQKQSPQRIILRISETLTHLAANNQIPFVFGGSKQIVLASASTLYSRYPENSQLILICSKPFLRREYDGDKGTSDNVLTILNRKHPDGKKLIFGPHLRYFPSKFIDTIDGTECIRQQVLKNNKFVLNSDIRRYKTKIKELGRNTQARFIFGEIYNEKAKVHVSLTLDAVERFMGCRDITVQGLECEEILEIMFFLGSRNNVVGVDISQFNPSCEDYESSLIILNFLYYFLMGRATVQ